MEYTFILRENILMMHFKSKHSEYYDFTKDREFATRWSKLTLSIFPHKFRGVQRVTGGLGYAVQKQQHSRFLKSRLCLDRNTWERFFQGAGCPEPVTGLTEIIESVLFLWL